MTTSNAKLNLSTKIGYGLASFGDSVFYSVVICFLVYYLTAIAEVAPGPAGTISSVALLVSAFVTLLVGHFSDNSTYRKGRRRHFVMVAAPVLTISFIAIFSSFGFTGTSAIIFYMIFVLLFWSSYCTFLVPYTALGAELTDCYVERTSIRSYTAFCIQVGGILGLAAPLYFASIAIDAGLSNSVAWTFATTILGLLAATSIVVMLYTTRGRDRVLTESERDARKNIFYNYIQALKAKPTKYLLVIILVFTVINAIFAGNLTFYAIYRLGLQENITSSIYALQFLCGAALAPLINLLARKTDKKIAFIIVYILAACFIGIFTFIGVDSYIKLLLLAISFIFANAGFWQLCTPILYDVAEVVELNTGLRLEGSLSSLWSFLIQIGGSIASLIFGWTLHFSGFQEGSIVQSQSALDTIVKLETIVPIIGCLIIVATMVFFPINKKTYALIQNALKEKEEVGTFIKAGLKRIV